MRSQPKTDLRFHQSSYETPIPSLHITTLIYINQGSNVQFSIWVIGGESSEAAFCRHATAEKATQREFQKNLSTFTRKIRFCSTGYTLKGVPFKPH
ncbi:hypothetical protein NIES4073_29710 [Kalymmatonema gypsitolerans NIES-4073]|nr:hypothetical protein NIES4073_29710 [Scytonema sp. NIES-4073]